MPSKKIEEEKEVGSYIIILIFYVVLLYHIYK
jgi:hypothetical protein